MGARCIYYIPLIRPKTPFISKNCARLEKYATIRTFTLRFTPQLLSNSPCGTRSKALDWSRHAATIWPRLLGAAKSSNVSISCVTVDKFWQYAQIFNALYTWKVRGSLQYYAYFFLRNRYSSRIWLIYGNMRLFRRPSEN